MSSAKLQNPTFKMLVRIYKFVMILLSLTIMVLSVWDLIFKLNEEFIVLVSKFDFLIMSIFIADLIVNLKLAKDKKHFIKISIIELLLIIPFAVFLKVPGMLKKTTGIDISKGKKISFVESYPKIKGFINILLSQKFILKSIAFFMKPSVIRATKFFNLSRNYFNKTKNN